MMISNLKKTVGPHGTNMFSNQVKRTGHRFVRIRDKSATPPAVFLYLTDPDLMWLVEMSISTNPKMSISTIPKINRFEDTSPD